MTVKICKSCKIEKENDEFYININNTGNRENTCKTCRKLRQQRRKSTIRENNNAPYFQLSAPGNAKPFWVGNLKI